VLTGVSTDLKDKMLEEIAEAAELASAGHGLSFVVPIQEIVGVVHLVEQ
jgi:nitrogen regulatory protein PII